MSGSQIKSVHTKGEGRLRDTANLLANLFFFLMCAAILFSVVFFNANFFLSFNKVALVLVTLLTLLVFLLVWKGIQLLPVSMAKHERRVAVLLFLFYAVVQFGFAMLLRVDPEIWDFGLIYHMAESYALGSGVEHSEHLSMYPNLIGYYVFLCLYYSFLHLFGVSNFEIPSILLNIAFILTAILFLFLCVRKLLGKRRGLFVLIAAFLTCPFVLYTPIFYTDTLSLPFPIIAVYLWLKIRDGRENTTRGKQILLSMALGLVVFLGVLFKQTVAIVLPALWVDILIRSGKRLWVYLLISTCVFAGAYLSFQIAVPFLPMVPLRDEQYALPFTHWIMMGLHKYGGYYQEDLDLTRTVEGLEARTALNLRVIGERLHTLGFKGVVHHILDKLAATFGDGTYWTPVKLNRVPLNSGVLHEFFLEEGSFFSLHAYVAQAIEMAMLYLCAGAAFLKRKCKETTFVRIALIGLVLFLLIWETRSRYLVNFFPLFLLCMAEGLPERGLVQWRKTRRFGLGTE